MAAFPHHNPAFLLDSLLLPNTTTVTYPPPSQLLQHNPIDVAPHGSNNEPLSKSDSSSMVIELDSDDHKETSFDNKRKKNINGSCLSSAQSQDMRGIKAKRQRKCKEGEEKKNKCFKKEQKKVVQEPPTGYIHVRARRGQATDSHSLAERVRREKISERMRLLQGLVPGCDKVTGKALMLDEIINYVQSLQYQVEFLSMKLASVNPVLHDFGADMKAFMVKPEKPLESIMHQSPTFADNSTKNNYSLQDNAAPFLPQQGQMLTAFPQDNENLLWDVYDQRQRLLNQYGFNNLCSF